MFHLKPFTSQAKKEVAKQDKSYNLILLNQNLYLFLEGIQKYYFMNFTCQFILLHNNLYFFISEFFKLFRLFLFFTLRILVLSDKYCLIPNAGRALVSMTNPFQLEVRGKPL